MEHIKIPRFHLEYPTGDNPKVAREFVRTASKTFIKKLQRKVPINIWCRGSSGSILASFLSIELRKFDCRICYVRKGGEKQHNSKPNPINGINIIIDDFICSGETIEAIISDMNSRSVEYLIVANGSEELSVEIKLKIQNLISA